uniref:Uncharacterized protein n=1 Tax=Solanum lycopersicum TaxID=4081 RepID=A0A3Q7HRK8_SOLLC
MSTVELVGPAVQTPLPPPDPPNIVQFSDLNHNKDPIDTTDTHTKKTHSSDIKNKTQQQNNLSTPTPPIQPSEQRIPLKNNYQFPKVSSNFDKAKRIDKEISTNNANPVETNNPTHSHATPNYSKSHPSSHNNNFNHNPSTSNTNSKPYNASLSTISKPSYASTISENLKTNLQGKNQLILLMVHIWESRRCISRLKTISLILRKTVALPLLGNSQKGNQTWMN